MDPVLLLLLAALAVLAVHLALKRRAFVNKVNALPGPPTAPVFGNLLLVARNNFGKGTTLCRT